MAFNSFLRRASASILPLSIRSAGTRSSFDGVISAVFNVQNRHLIGSQFLQFLRFSTATGDNIGGIIESVNSPQQFSDVQDGFPFKIHAGYGKGVLYLKRQFRDEIIKVVVFYNPHDQQTQQELGLYVEIFHGNDCLNFLIDARRDQMAVRKISMSGNLEPCKKFLEIRGMKPSTTNFMFDYCKKKFELESEGIGMQWLLPQR